MGPAVPIGTFSSVYRALDMRFVLCNNNHWNICRETGERLYVKKDSEMCPSVAIKRIYVTSSPARILAEIKLLKSFRSAFWRIASTDSG